MIEVHHAALLAATVVDPTKRGSLICRDVGMEGDGHLVTFADDRVMRARIVGVDDTARAAWPMLWSACPNGTSERLAPVVRNHARRVPLVWFTDALPDSLAAVFAESMEMARGRETPNCAGKGVVALANSVPLCA
jgi:hypothetical protein